MSNEHKLLSVGIPVLNGERGIARAIKSALQTEYRPLEVIVSDNGSTDGTSDIVADLAREHPEVKHHRYEETISLGSNWNRSFHLSSGSYFKLSPHDDFYTPDYAGAAIDILEHDEDSVVVYGRAVFATEKGVAFGVTDDPGPGVVAPTTRQRVSIAMRTIRSYPAVNQGVVRREMMERSLGFLNVETMDRLRVAEFALHGSIRLAPEPILVIQIPEGRAAKNEWVYNDPANAERRRLRLLRMAGAFNDAVNKFTSDGRERVVLKSVLAYSYLRRRLVKMIDERRRDNGTEGDQAEALRRLVDALPPDTSPHAIERHRELQQRTG